MTQYQFGHWYFEERRSYSRAKEQALVRAKAYLDYLKRYKLSGRLLDVGCAYGFFLEVFRERFEVFGMDISEYAIKQAKRHLPTAQGRLICHDCQNPWPYPDDFFDVVIAIAVIEHLKNPHAMIQEVFRCLKPKGIFMLHTCNLLYEILPRVFPKLFPTIAYGDSTHVSPMYPWELRSLLADFDLLESIRKPAIGKLWLLERKFNMPILKTVGKLPILNSTLTWICRSKKSIDRYHIKQSLLHQ
jgi:SAM-dependent methyltransferase